MVKQPHVGIFYTVIITHLMIWWAGHLGRVSPAMVESQTVGGCGVPGLERREALAVGKKNEPPLASAVRRPALRLALRAGFSKSARSGAPSFSSLLAIGKRRYI